MDIIWHGNTCFSFKSKRADLVVNPDDQAGKLKGDIVLTSLDDKTVEVTDAIKVFNCPGEYEMKDVPIVGFSAHTGDPKEDDKAEPTIIFYFKFGKLKYCHLGGLGHALTNEMINKIGDIDILFINIGSDSNLNKKQALEVIEAIDPRAVIAMGDGNFSEIAKELGAEKVEAEDKFSIKAPKDLPEDKRQYIVLNKA